MTMDTRDMYYIRLGKRVSGPISADALRRLAASGQVTNLHLISRNGRDWLPAEEMGNLLAESPRGEPAMPFPAQSGYPPPSPASMPFPARSEYPPPPSFGGTEFGSSKADRTAGTPATGPSRNRKRKSNIGIVLFILGFIVVAVAFGIWHEVLNPVAIPFNRSKVSPVPRRQPVFENNPVGITFNRSKFRSVPRGQPVFENTGASTVSGIRVQIVQKNQTVRQQGVIPRLSPGESTTLPRGEGWVVEPGEAVVVMVDGYPDRKIVF